MAKDAPNRSPDGSTNDMPENSPDGSPNHTPHHAADNSADNSTGNATSNSTDNSADNATSNSTDNASNRESEIRTDISLKEIFFVFLRLGFFAYGGPAAHTAMMNEELVEKRKWVTSQRFLDLMSATNLIPGPNSTELAITLGYEKGGWRGLLIAGACFIFPAFAIVLLFAWLYASYGLIPQVQSVLAGVKAVVIAVIFQALVKLFRTAIKNWWQVVLLLIAVALALTNLDELWVLLGTGLLALLYQWVKSSRSPKTSAFGFLPLGFLPNSLLQSRMLPNSLLQPNIRSLSRWFSQVTQVPIYSGMGLGEIFLRFLKIGALLYGSGYVLVAYLESEFVNTGYITYQVLLDAVAVGQITPGPVFTTATFVGYQLHGLPGAVLATIGIFLPSFLLVGLLVHLMEQMRKSKLVAAILDGVNVASLALMAVTTFSLGQSSLTHPLHWLILGASLILLFWKKVNSMWLLIGGGLIGYFFL